MEDTNQDFVSCIPSLDPCTVPFRETINLDATFIDGCSDHQEAMVPSCQPHVGGQSWITYSYRVGHAMNLRNAPRSHLP